MVHATTSFRGPVILDRTRAVTFKDRNAKTRRKFLSLNISSTNFVFREFQHYSKERDCFSLKKIILRSHMLDAWKISIVSSIRLKIQLRYFLNKPNNGQKLNIKLMSQFSISNQFDRRYWNSNEVPRTILICQKVVGPFSEALERVDICQINRQ